MGKRNVQVDRYIADSADFAKPILKHIRLLVHAGCPDVEEAIKWGFPHFMYRGMLCSMASFKNHCAFGFWKGSLIVGKNATHTEKAMGQFGRITSVKDLPDDAVILGYVHEAVRLNDAGIKSPTRSKPKTKRELVVPDDFIAALRRNTKASATFEAFNYSHKKEYIEWITEAKTEVTRSKRLSTAIKWMAGGKPRNWKYIRK